DAAVRLWPTPIAADAEARGPHGNGQPTLSSATSSWATPCARDGKGATMFDSGHRHGPGLPDQATALAGPKSSSEPRTLNPLFVEWLMGFPIGWSSPGEWTDSAASATPSSPRRRRSPSASSREG